MKAQDHLFMQRALRLAQKGLYGTDPNPRVGCVVVKGGNIVGEGWHRKAGEPHAEVLALRQAGAEAENATAYVTLEPCSHTGKTPPCAEALIKAGVSRVVVAMRDPNPQVSGQGLKKLQTSGIKVECGLMETQARALNPGFIKRMETGRPYVRVKMAMSLDGRTAMASGESQWITGEAARQDVQRLRARSSAVLTGIGTVLLDDPSMNVRLSAKQLGVAEIRQPLRVILDSAARFPAHAKTATLDGDVLVMTTARAGAEINATESSRCKFVSVAEKDGHVDLNTALNYLSEIEINEVHVEAGALLSGAFLQQQLVDEVVVYMAPHIMGDQARGLFALPGLSKMKDRISLDIQDVRMLAKDLRIIATPVYHK
ncbi:MAG: bifunctional diaminohydroxyphosphoribosylaminopyrimidine deaminase/5-amino-6-(5-phosphoribosylamino)uracil reductase RibD [Gammaproteobacteria bacterium]|jgi:diaminohydroxyphosphoribosylaminopyrimidine deaminase/5-amino-6-(5-phosphoribosylamino)uracil reductase|nr:bifunctional diaminohydroxyphosphoribosylaminopyrimidine deaminase/5-amino-6-(5-phosphoribosylamino)uracil reductase RibD [Gammaproteobacteria bacterium]